MRLKHSKNTSTPKIYVPLSVQDQTIAHIRECGDNGDEGFVVWSGISLDNKLIVRSAMIPSGQVFRHHLSMRFSDKTIENIADTILSKREKLIAQVHSHPYEAFHSQTDDRFPLVHRKGFLSIVIPYFGKYGFENFDTIRVYQYVEDNRWTELDPKMVRRRLHIEGTSKWKRLKSIKRTFLAQKN